MKYDVLLAEDEESLRKLYEDAFTVAGCTVKTVADGKEAVDAALTDHPKVIVMDILMPGLGGLAAVAEIRRDDWGKNATVLYLTNQTDDATVNAAARLGDDPYVTKATTPPSEVAAKVKSLVEKALAG